MVSKAIHQAVYNYMKEVKISDVDTVAKQLNLSRLRASTALLNLFEHDKLTRKRTSTCATKTRCFFEYTFIEEKLK